MKIYDKKLSNLQELKRERQQLKARLKGDDVPKTSSKESVKEEKEESFASGLLSGVTSGSLLTSALNLAPTIFDIIKNRSFGKAAPKEVLRHNSHKKGFLSTVVTDVVSSYVKWKLIEFTYKGIKKVIRSEQGRKMSHKATSRLQSIFSKK